MTEHNGVSAALLRRLRTEAPALATAATALLAQELPVYRRLPAEELRGDVRRIVEETILGFAELLAGRPSVDPRRLAGARASAGRRAEEGIPVDAVTSAYHVGAQVCVDAIRPHATADEMTVLHRELLGYLRIMLAEVMAGYLEERQALIGESGAARQSLLSALLDGGDSRTVAQRAGISLPARYAVLSLVIAAHPDEQHPDIDATVAARRKIRRITAELDRRIGQPVLARIAPDQAIVLLPATAPAGGPLDGDSGTRLRSLIDALSRAAEAPILAGVTAGPPDQVPALARQAAEVRDVAAVFRRPAGLYQLGDLLLEYQLTRPGAARAELAALLRPIIGKPDLVPTLRLYLEANLNRRKVATQLHVHPNTVDYRIRRVAVLTGLDVAEHRDLLTLSAALAAHDAESATAASG
ncbi:helix-turn-helix domain-containing protein [Actinoplanes sp. NPDC023936]|uniref:PucR family transcriptional regulator n=1 Tax=Actinoplanes sp. NPDC023936 TaxID=3154910 RepID=UPI0033E34F9B